ncbi:hypothetical protein P8A21_41080 (plasmid) [Streptomyces poriferorum]|nr:hypothetical protein [Streptomyces sp. Alt1]WLQ53907.1 hypothetical protein P8A21_41080 [Streptomyces sp. Alt1]
MSMRVVLAGKAAELGDAWLETLGDWGDKGLKVALTAIVVITVVRKVSLKAGISALIAMVLALGIYDARGTLADIFEDEVKNPANNGGAAAAVGSPRPDVLSGGAL